VKIRLPFPVGGSLDGIKIYSDVLTKKTAFHTAAVFPFIREQHQESGAAAPFAGKTSKPRAVLYKRVNKFFTEKLALALDEC